MRGLRARAVCRGDIRIKDAIDPSQDIEQVRLLPRAPGEEALVPPSTNTSRGGVGECTMLDGSLLLIDVEQGEPVLPRLREVTGHVIFSQLSARTADISHLVPSLAVIRGHSLYDRHSLVVFSYEHIQELGLYTFTALFSSLLSLFASSFCSLFLLSLLFHIPRSLRVYCSLLLVSRRALVLPPVCPLSPLATSACVRVTSTVPTTARLVVLVPIVLPKRRKQHAAVARSAPRVCFQ